MSKQKRHKKGYTDDVEERQHIARKMKQGAHHLREKHLRNAFTSNSIDANYIQTLIDNED